MPHDDEQARTVFLAERKKGIGGSDTASLFNEGYGCKRRLTYDKRDEPADFPRQDNDAMALGRFLEPYFAKKYAEKTGRNILVKDEPVVHPEYPELRVNVDRMVLHARHDQGDAGVLEIKSVGRDVFYKVKREGLPEDYILQLQHAMLVTGATWGSFAIGSRDSGQLLFWDVERDEKLTELILAAGRAFWEDLQNGVLPDRLEPDDHRCQKCEYRRTCQGAALIQLGTSKENFEQDESLRPILTEYLERKSLQHEADDLVAETKEQFQTEIGHRTALSIAGKTVYYRPQTTNRWDGKGIAGAYANLLALARLAAEKGQPVTAELLKAFPSAEVFQVPTQSRPLRIF